MLKHQPFVLIILDGWGYSENPVHNAIHSAKKPNWDALWKNYPHTLIAGSGHAVGLPQDQWVIQKSGHLTMGAGRTVYQEFTRVDKAIEDGDFFHNPVFLSALKKAKTIIKPCTCWVYYRQAVCNSHQGQIHAMATLAAEHGPEKFYIHAFWMVAIHAEKCDGIFANTRKSFTKNRSRKNCFSLRALLCNGSR